MPLTKRQVEGAVALVVITALIYVFSVLTSLFPSIPQSPVPFSEKGAGTQAVGLAIDGNDKGIFFLPPGATAFDLLATAGVDLFRKLNGEIGARSLSSGDKVFLTCGSFPSLIVGKMTAAQALALDLPLDINQAAFDELILIPGIGEKTAAKIIALREKKGAFRNVAELTEIRGIKEKKLAKLIRYLYAERR
jgi:competence protein ComEA